MGKKFFTTILLSLFITMSHAQYFTGSFSNSGSQLTFKIKPVVDDITTSIAYIEFNVRYSTSLNLTFSSLASNTTTFPGLNIQKASERTFNGQKYTRFVFNTGTIASNTYTENNEYVVFTVDVSDAATAMSDFELATDLNSNPSSDYYFSVNDGAGNPLIDLSGSSNFLYNNQLHAGGTEYYITLPAVPLPVEAIEFEAYPGKDLIDINWNISRPFQLEGFELQRMTKDRNFEKITFVPFEEERFTYQFEDKDVKSNTDYFYRLKLIDQDGSFTYSDIKKAKINGSESNIAIYPNPVKDYFMLRSENARAEDILIFDTQGKNVTSLVKINNQQLEFHEINTSLLNNGIYYIQIDQKVRKFVLQRD